MNKGGAPKGNSNASKGKPWHAAIQRAIAQGDPDKLRKLAERLIDKAMEGDMQAMKEIGDRLDGKSKQQIEATVNTRVIMDRKVTRLDGQIESDD